MVDHGTTGYIVDTVEDAILTMPRVMSLDRRAVHRKLEREVYQCPHGKRLCARLQIVRGQDPNRLGFGGVLTPGYAGPVNNPERAGH